MDVTLNDDGLPNLVCEVQESPHSWGDYTHVQTVCTRRSWFFARAGDEANKRGNPRKCGTKVGRINAAIMSGLQCHKLYQIYTDIAMGNLLRISEYYLCVYKPKEHTALYSLPGCLIALCCMGSLVVSFPPSFLHMQL